MTPWFRALRPTGLLLLLLAGPPYLPQAAAYEPVPAESRAGSRAGEGRERPGRQVLPADGDGASAHPDGSASPDQEASAVPEPSPPPSAPSGRPARPVDARQAPDRPVRASEPVLKVLPLGSGLVLIGLGLGLAFLSLKVRRS